MAEPMAFRDIAARLGAPRTTVYDDYRRALEKLGLDYRQFPRRIRRKPAHKLAAA